MTSLNLFLSYNVYLYDKKQKKIVSLSNRCRSSASTPSSASSSMTTANRKKIGRSTPFTSTPTWPQNTDITIDHLLPGLHNRHSSSNPEPILLQMDIWGSKSTRHLDLIARRLLQWVSFRHSDHHYRPTRNEDQPSSLTVSFLAEPDKHLIQERPEMKINLPVWQCPSWLNEINIWYKTIQK